MDEGTKRKLRRLEERQAMLMEDSDSDIDLRKRIQEQKELLDEEELSEEEINKQLQ